MSQVTIRTKQGPLAITRRVNAEGQVTGRVAGKTYAADTWAEVEKLIRAEMTVEIIMHPHLRIDASRWGAEEESRTFHSDVRFSVVRVSDYVENRGRLVSGLYGNDTWSDADDVGDALGIDADEGEAATPWTESREATLVALLQEMTDRDTAFVAFVTAEGLGSHLDEGVTLDQAIGLGREAIEEKIQEKARKRKAKKVGRPRKKRAKKGGNR